MLQLQRKFGPALPYLPLALAMIVFFICGATHYISNSEFWPITLAQEILRSRTAHPVLIYKPVFHLSLVWPYFLNLSNATHIEVVKIFYAAIGTGILFSMYRISRINLNRFHSILFSLLLLSSCLVFSQLNRVRSDILALLFSLSALYLQVLWAQSKNHRLAIVATICTFLSFLTTPKAIIFVLLNFIFLTIFCRDKKKDFKLLFLINWGLLSIVPIFILAGDWIFQSTKGNEAYRSAMLFFFKSFGNETQSFIKLFESPYNISFLKRDLVWWLLWVVSWILSVSQWKAKALTQFEKAGVITATVSVGVLLLFPEPLLFMIGATLCYSSFIFIPALRGFFDFYSPQRAVAVIMVAIGLQLVGPLKFFWTSNFLQIEKIQELTLFISQFDNPTIYDGFGILPRANNILSYIGPFDNESIRNGKAVIKQMKPSILLQTDRMYLLEPAFSRVLDLNYKNAGAGVWVQKNLVYSKEISPQVHISQIFTFEPNY